MPHPETNPYARWHLAAFAILILFFVILSISGCSHLNAAVSHYAKAKAAKLVECQAQELTRAQGEQCLGLLAHDLQTDACAEASRWLDSLPEGATK